MTADFYATKIALLGLVSVSGPEVAVLAMPNQH